ncbi:response regulator transcription factor [bacterium]|nr:response regulator transcription factor [bacterium]
MFELTKREMDILKYLIKGYENEEIASELFMSKHTVKAHVSSILRKLHAKNRAGALYIAMRNNLL